MYIEEWVLEMLVREEEEAAQDVSTGEAFDEFEIFPFDSGAETIAHITTTVTSNTLLIGVGLPIQTSTHIDINDLGNSHTNFHIIQP